jgi:hypothetical protein
VLREKIRSPLRTINTVLKVITKGEFDDPVSKRRVVMQKMIMLPAKMIFKIFTIVRRDRRKRPKSNWKEAGSNSQESKDVWTFFATKKLSISALVNSPFGSSVPESREVNPQNPAMNLLIIIKIRQMIYIS